MRYTQSHQHKQEYGGRDMWSQFKKEVSGLNKLLCEHIKILAFFFFVYHSYLHKHLTHQELGLATTNLCSTSQFAKHF